MTMQQIRRLYEHMHWADQRVLEVLSTGSAAAPQAARELFAHVLASERVWLLRLRGEDGSVQPIWPTLAPEELEALAAVSRAEYSRFLEGLREPDLARLVQYTNQQGRTYRTAVGDILLHVALHGAYPRGQVARAVRQEGGEPVNTDYITFVREQAEPAPATPARGTGSHG